MAKEVGKYLSIDEFLRIASDLSTDVRREDNGVKKVNVGFNGACYVFVEDNGGTRSDSDSGIRKGVASLVRDGRKVMESLEDVPYDFCNGGDDVVERHTAMRRTTIYEEDSFARAVFDKFAGDNAPHY